MVEKLRGRSLPENKDKSQLPERLKTRAETMPWNAAGIKEAAQHDPSFSRNRRLPFRFMVVSSLSN